MTGERTSATRRWSRREWLSLVGAAPMCAASAAAQPSGVRPEALTLTHRARTLQPGELIVLEVRARASIGEVHGTAFGAPVAFTRVGDVWQGVVGVDLEAAPGSHVVTARGRDASGAHVSSTTLRIRPKQFETRRLTVPPKFVTPPPGTEERIERERRAVSAILASPLPERQWQGPFIRPVPGIALSSFGVRSVYNGQLRSFHTGTDFRGAEGTPIKAPARGRVVLAEEHYFSGNQVALDHGQGLFSFFAHLSAFAVVVGDVVTPGDVLGAVGATGRVTGPHLHWSVRLGRARIDALSLLSVLGEPTSTAGG